MEAERPMPARVLLCTVHRDDFYLPLDADEGTTRCPEPGCEASVVIYARVGARDDGAVTGTLTIPPGFSWDDESEGASDGS